MYNHVREKPTNCYFIKEFIKNTEKHKNNKFIAQLFTKMEHTSVCSN